MKYGLTEFAEPKFRTACVCEKIGDEYGEEIDTSPFTQITDNDNNVYYFKIASIGIEGMLFMHNGGFRQIIREEAKAILDFLKGGNHGRNKS